MADVCCNYSISDMFSLSNSFIYIRIFNLPFHPDSYKPFQNVFDKIKSMSTI